MTRPLPVTIVAFALFVAAALVIGALWSGSAGGQAFAEAATSAYESSWLPWLCGAMAAACAAGLLLGFRFARTILVIWMGYGVIEGLFLLDKQHYNLVVIAIYAAITAVLFLPQANEWFRSRAG